MWQSAIVGIIILTFNAVHGGRRPQYFYPTPSSSIDKNQLNDLQLTANFGTAQNQNQLMQLASTMMDPQNRPTFQKVVYLGYPPPMPIMPFRRRRFGLFPFFLLGVTAGSAVILGGALAAGGIQNG